MVNYGKTKVYKIWSPKGDKIYIGVTTKEYLSQRMDEHRSKYKGYLKSDKNKMNTTSVLIFEEYGVENCFIELLESKECNSKDEQSKLEGEWIRKLDCVNISIPNRSDKEKKEYILNYLGKNKIKISNRQKDYRVHNLENIKNQHNKLCTCICGSEYQHANKSRHERTNKHINFLQQTQ